MQLAHAHTMLSACTSPAGNIIDNNPIKKRKGSVADVASTDAVIAAAILPAYKMGDKSDTQPKALATGTQPHLRPAGEETFFGP